jgi:hypothetical protein
MSLIGNIRTTLSKVAAGFSDQLIEYRLMTSAPNANPRIYGSWVAIPNARIVDTQSIQLYDQDTGIWYNDDRCTLRIPWAVDGVELSSRTSQVRIGGPNINPADLLGRIWAVDKERTEGAGSVRVYGLSIRTPLLANARKGGV